MILFTYRVKNYQIITPGGINKIESEISIDNINENESNINSVFVYSIDNPTLFQVIVSYFVHYIEYTDITQSNLTIEEIRTIGLISKEVSIYNSLILAYNSTPSYTINYELNPTIYLISNDSVNKHIPTNSIISSVNGNKISNTNEFNIQISNTKCGESIEVGLTLDNGSTKNMNIKRDDDTCKFGIYLYNKINILNANPSYNYEKRDNSYGGSAGLMQTISLYNGINNDDITKGYSIAGTGTIDLNGNVGKIGGAYQKILSADKMNVEYFFILDDKEDPNGNYNEANRAIKKLNSNLTLVPVETFYEALEYLENLD